MELGQIVYSTRGHDSNRPFVVVDIDDQFVYICDGKMRCLEKPKKKKIKHVKATKEVDLKLAQKLTSGETLTDKEIRKILSGFERILEGKEV